jgi:hypothetical protein
MKIEQSLDVVERIGTGLAFILFPLLFVFAFAVHPGLLNPHELTDQEIILRAHDNSLLAVGHVLTIVDAALVIVVTLHLMRLLDQTSVSWARWVGFIGAVLTVISAVALAVEKGAEALTMTAVDTLPERQFSQAMPALVAIFSHQGWMWLVWGVVLMLPGLVIQGVATFSTNVIPRWQSAMLVVGMLLMAAGGRDGFEIFGLAAFVIVSIGLVPYGVQLITNSARTIENVRNGGAQAPRMINRPSQLAS